MKAVIILAVLFAVASADYFKNNLVIQDVSKWTNWQHVTSKWVQINEFDIRYELAYGRSLGYKIEVRPHKGEGELKNITLTGTIVTLNRDTNRNDPTHYELSFNNQYRGPSQWIDGTTFSQAAGVTWGYYDVAKDQIKVQNYVKYTVDGVDNQKQQSGDEEEIVFVIKHE